MATIIPGKNARDQSSVCLEQHHDHVPICAVLINLQNGKVSPGWQFRKGNGKIHMAGAVWRRWTGDVKSITECGSMITHHRRRVVERGRHHLPRKLQ